MCGSFKGSSQLRGVFDVYESIFIILNDIAILTG